MPVPAENLQVFRIEHQLQLARLGRLIFQPILEPLGFQKLGVEYQFKIARCVGGSLRSTRRRTSAGQRADRSFSQTTVT